MANGQIERRESSRTGKISWRVRWVDASGKRSSRSFAKRSQAKEYLARISGELVDVRLGRPQRPRGADDTLREAAERWLKTRPPKRAKDDRSRLSNHILPAFGDYTLDQVGTDEELQRTIVRHLETKDACHHAPSRKSGAKPKAKPRKLSGQTIKNALACLSKMLHDLGYKSVSLAYRAGEAPYSWIQDPKAIPRFLDACPPWFRVAAALAVYGGLRKGEVAGLRRDDIDWSNELIHIRRSYDGPTKNYAIRAIPIAPELAAILKPWLLQHSGEHVVTQPVSGEPITIEYDGLNRNARRVSKRVDGCDEVNFHALRHTAASHWALAGVPLAMISKLLGHKTLSMTQRYAHLSAESIANDPRVRLSFGEAPAGDVVQLPTKATS